jgi:photosynthetic reaction center cytochrome c subunit
MADDGKSWWERSSGQPIVEWFPFGMVALILAFFTVVVFVGIVGTPHSVDDEQIGFRGTGMQTIYKTSEAKEARAVLDTLADLPIDNEVYVYEEDEEVVLAGDVYQNVQVLGHVDEINFLRLMTAIQQWVAPDQGCEYCHGPDLVYESDDYYPKVVARRMLQMTMNINANWQDHVAATGVNCYTCHRGQNVPAEIWFEQEPEEKSAGGWLNNQNMASPRVASASLPSNIYSKFLMGDDPIRVISQETNADTQAGQTIKETEWSFALMIHMSKSLNVNCAYCHNTRSMSQWDQSPPQRTTSWYGIRMMREINNDYLAPLQPVYPEFRLGPTGDAPKANCATCHQGVYKPLFGEPAIENWPELMPPEAADAEQAALAE